MRFGQGGSPQNLIKKIKVLVNKANTTKKIKSREVHGTTRNV